MRRFSGGGGFTLIELLVTVGVLAVLTTIAYPSFKSTIRSNRLAAANNELLSAIGLARSEAMRNHFGSGICAANADASACDAGNTDWGANGWLVWADADAKPGFQAGDPVLRASQRLPVSMQIDNADGVIRFDRRGRPLPADVDAGITFKPTDCRRGEVGMARRIDVNLSGQTRTLRQDCP